MMWAVVILKSYLEGILFVVLTDHQLLKCILDLEKSVACCISGGMAITPYGI